MEILDLNCGPSSLRLLIEGSDMGFGPLYAPMMLLTEVPFEVVRSSNELLTAESAVRKDCWAVILDSSMRSTI